VLFPSDPFPALTFEDYLQRLPPYPREIFHTIVWHFDPSTCMEYILASNTEFPLIIVSDGSSQEENTMSYGLVASTTTGERLFTCNGPATGPISSHRAECTGCLAGGLILRHLATFTSTALPFLPKVKVISDNKGMITSLKARQEYKTVYTNSTLKADWDLLEEITQVYQSICLPDAINFEWVKGHQDESGDFELPLEAKLNIEADKAAGEALLLPSDGHRRVTHMMEHTGCILAIDQASVHSKYTQSLRNSYALPEYRAYLIRKHQWLPETYDDVDWPAFQMATRNYFSTEVHLVKLIHDQLPTRHRVHRYQPWVPPHCHYCDSTETFYHLQTCSHHPVSSQFRTTLVDHVAAYFKSFDIPIRFQSVFLHSLDLCLHPATEVPSLFRAVEFAQQSIGLHLITRGFLSLQWRHLLKETIRESQWTTTTGPKDSPLDPHAATSDSADDTEPETYDPTAAIMESTRTVVARSRDFDRLVQDSAAEAREHRQLAPTIFFAGLIKLLWSDLGQLWLDHLKEVHKPDEAHPTSKHSLETRNNLQSHVSKLQTLRESTNAESQARYFLPDPAKFLSTATESSLRQYVQAYHPAIVSTIRADAISASVPLHSVNRLIRNALMWRSSSPQSPRDLTPSSSPNQSRVPISAPSPDTNTTSQHPALEEAAHRKRNRLRSMSSTASTVVRLSPTLFE